jgi:hypothetical protein
MVASRASRNLDLSSFLFMVCDDQSIQLSIYLYIHPPFILPIIRLCVFVCMCVLQEADGKAATSACTHRLPCC